MTTVPSGEKRMSRMGPELVSTIIESPGPGPGSQFWIIPSFKSPRSGPWIPSCYSYNCQVSRNQDF